jgi:hypothetical protein
MASYNFINPATPIRNGCAVAHAPQMNSGEGVTLKTDREQDLTLPNNTSAVLDIRFKVGGSTGWERPGSDLT